MGIETGDIRQQGSLIDGEEQPEIIESVHDLSAVDVERLKSKRPHNTR